MKSLILTLSLLLLSTVGWAHQLSTAYMTLDPVEDGFKGQVSIPWEDLSHELPLDRDGNGQLTWGEVLDQEPLILSRLTSGLVATPHDALCRTEFAPEVQTNTLANVSVLVAQFSVLCRDGLPTSVTYNLIWDHVPGHKVLVSIGSGDTRIDGVLTAESREVSLSPEPFSQSTEWVHFWKEGVWHIWIGADHILFILLLLAVVVVSYRNGRWEAAASFRESVHQTVLLVTTFTLAHSLTFTVAALGWVPFDVRLIEIGIAVSIVVAAFNNVRPFLPFPLVVVFAFGLLHGFGFANVMRDLPGTDALSLGPIIAFNLGVESGQLAIVLVALPILWWVRHTRFYRGLGLQSFSILAGLVGLYWTYTRWI